MTQLLSLFNQVFGVASTSHDLERFIVANNPACEKDLEELTQDYLYHCTGLRGL
ncbi:MULTISPECIES: hypothetical protein [unclassified Polynucleobacter]|uniref:hypothetical protein n=1 Tax=unclassified Polynucleobacter TaxID=2640945 RepID=UPI001372C504|nr:MULTISPECIES: hypothetical protein [unclassified Polynucleobacter]